MVVFAVGLPLNGPVFGAGTPLVFEVKCLNGKCMNCGSIMDDIQAAGNEAGGRLNIHIIYEDVATGKHAKASCDRLAEHLGPGWNVNIEMSSFESLRAPRARRTTARALAGANVVYFSCHDGELPPEVLEWSEGCLARQRSPKALVALVNRVARSRATRESRMERTLSGLAERRGMQFFSQVCQPMGAATTNRPGRPGQEKGPLC